MSLSKGVSRIGHVTGIIVGILCGGFIGLCIAFAQASFGGRAAIPVGIIFGFIAGVVCYYLFVLLALAINWIIEGFRKK